jgi:hypothetical protein
MCFHLWGVLGYTRAPGSGPTGVDRTQERHGNRAADSLPLEFGKHDVQPMRQLFPHAHDRIGPAIVLQRELVVPGNVHRPKIVLCLRSVILIHMHDMHDVHGRAKCGATSRHSNPNQNICDGKHYLSDSVGVTGDSVLQKSHFPI